MSSAFPKTAEFLQQYLADLNVGYQKLRSFHWNVEGKEFFTLHAKLQELYEDTVEEIDEIAERLLMIGQRPLSTMKEYLDKTGLKEAPAKGYSGKEVAEALLKDYEHYVKALHEGIQTSDKEGDQGTMDLLTKSLQKYEKLLWMLRAFLV